MLEHDKDGRKGAKVLPMVPGRPDPEAPEAAGDMAGFAARIVVALSSHQAPGRNRAAATPAHSQNSPNNCIGTQRGPDGRERR